MLCRSIAHETSTRPDSATPSCCSLSARPGRGAVAFAGEVQRRAPSPVPAEPGTDALGERVDVAVHAQHLLARLLAHRHRVTGVRRIHEHEVEMLEPGV